MRVVVRLDNSWLLIKGVYTATRPGRRRKRQRSHATAGTVVAESVDRPPVDGLRYTASIEVPATKVMRFVIRMFREPGHAVIVVEPHTVETYLARIYSSSREEARRVASLAERVVASLLRRGEGEEEEEYTASEVEEVEE
ncbi:MAG: hypothetical protein GXO15_02645 [Crenarchaeota archaeon]|nr:hypothetical protein [Thermoproteota archaeon]